jgi:hypothetical protein
MPENNTPNIPLLFLTAATLFGLALIPILLIQPNLQAETSPIRTPLISATYSIICIAGITAVFYPNKCRTQFQKPKTSPNTIEKSTQEIPFKGHHPNCENFKNNRITTRFSTYCAACTGLLIGAIIALAGIILFSLGFFAGAGNLWVLAIGESLMLAGLTQTRTKGYTKTTINALFVVGSFIILAATDLAGKSLVVDAYVLALIVFMLWFRILLSEWNNKRTCTTCGRCT